MIVLKVKQGSPEWHFARLGIPTASQFGRIVSTKTKKVLAGSETYMHELLAEWLIGVPNGIEAKGLMARGTEIEPWAIDYYELQRNVETTPVGVCMRDDRLVACSPDRFIGDDGGLEIKCPGAKQHVANLLGMGDDYFAQVQGNLWITGRKWWDLVSYHPEIPAAIVRVVRDEAYIAALESGVGQFVADMLAARKALIDQGAEPAKCLDPEFASSLQPPMEDPPRAERAEDPFAAVTGIDPNADNSPF